MKYRIVQIGKNSFKIQHSLIGIWFDANPLYEQTLFSSLSDAMAYIDSIEEECNTIVYGKDNR